MRRTPLLAALIFCAAAPFSEADDAAPKRGLFGRLLHPFSSSTKVPEYRNSKIRGLVLALQLPDEPIKLSEVRQLPVQISLTNRGDRAVELNFPTAQRVEIYLRDAAGRIVTRWSDNRAFEATQASILINSGEHLEYAETIATRDLIPNKVFTVEVMVPAYPELDTKRKSLTAP